MANALPQNNRVPSLVLSVIDRDGELEPNSQEGGRFGPWKLFKIVVDETYGFIKTEAGRNTLMSLATLGVYSQSGYQIWPFTFVTIVANHLITKRIVCSEKDREDRQKVVSNRGELDVIAMKEGYESFLMFQKSESDRWVDKLSKEDRGKLLAILKKHHNATLFEVSVNTDQKIARSEELASKGSLEVVRMVKGRKDFVDKAMEFGECPTRDEIRQEALGFLEAKLDKDRQKALEEFISENRPVVKKAKADAGIVENEEISTEEPGGRSALNQTQGGLRLRKPNQASNGDSHS